LLEPERRQQIRARFGKAGILLKSTALFCGREGFSHGLDPANFDAASLVFSASIQSCQIHLTQSWYFLFS
jgi:hypothetical protein